MTGDGEIRAGRGARPPQPAKSTSNGPFLPPDPSIEAPYRLTPDRALRVSILSVVAIAAFALLFFRLWGLQVLSGDRYRAAARENQLRTFRLEAPRGAILDRSGRPMVTNTAVTAIEFWPADITSPARRRTVIARLAAVLGKSEVALQRSVDRHGRDPLSPVTLELGASEAQVRYLLERRSDFPGVELADVFVRDYPFGAVATQLLGYVGEITAPQLKALRKREYEPGDHLGQAGVESAFDPYLRGTPGIGAIRVDATGTIRGARTVRRPAAPGNAVRLTIDIRLQRAAEQGLRDAIALAHKNGKWMSNGGALVAMDPRDGAILALASNPSYDPRIYAGKVDPGSLARLADPRANTPTLNRAEGGLYPPGSTFKPVTAIAALQERLLSPKEAIRCSPDFKVNGQVFRNWDPTVDRPMDLETALAASCDTYFYKVGLRFYRLPADRGHPLQAWAARMGIGSPTGIDVGDEANGLIPTPDWRRGYFRSAIDKLWKPGDSVQLAVGQGDLLATPLQMTRLYALLANGGTLVFPHVLDDVERPSILGGQPSVLRRFVPEPPRDIGVDRRALAVVRRGLYLGAHADFGTSSGIFGTFPIPVAGKTGTAEKYVSIPGFRGLADQAWWCGWGPFDRPTLVVCAMVENGGFGGEVAAPAALRVFERFFGVKAKPVGPVKSD